MSDLLLTLTMAPSAKSDDVLVAEFMERLEAKHPGVVEGYMYERVDDLHLNLFMWGSKIEEDERP